MKFLIDFENTNLTGLTGIEELGCSDKVIIFHTNQNDKMPFDLLAKIKCSLEFVRVSPGRQSLDMCLASRLGYLIGYKHGINAQLDIELDDSSLTDMEPDDIVVVSKDTDYISMVEMWNEQYHQCVGIRPTISGKCRDDGEPVNYGNIPDYSAFVANCNSSSACNIQETSKVIQRFEYNQYSDNHPKSKKQKRKEEEKANRIEQILKNKGMNRDERQEVFRCINRDPKTPNYRSDLYDLMCRILGNKNGRKTYHQIKQML